MPGVYKAQMLPFQQGLGAYCVAGWHLDSACTTCKATTSGPVRAVSPPSPSHSLPNGSCGFHGNSLSLSLQRWGLLSRGGRGECVRQSGELAGPCLHQLCVCIFVHVKMRHWYHLCRNGEKEKRFPEPPLTQREVNESLLSSSYVLIIHH